tara:strand:+ start:23511 stop:24035 length:525 start_codon:yes stop_codon:yes gene_type:complete
MEVEIRFPEMGTTLKDIDKFGSKKASKAKKKALQNAGAVLKIAIQQHLSLTTYTLADLERMDHPYAKRHGSIKVHPSRPFVVHQRSTKMRNSVTSESKWRAGGYGGGGGWGQLVGLDYGKEKYFKYVIEGTNKMLPRNTVFMVSQLKSVRKGMMMAVVQTLGRQLRTKATVRFK